MSKAAAGEGREVKRENKQNLRRDRGWQGDCNLHAQTQIQTQRARERESQSEGGTSTRYGSIDHPHQWKSSMNESIYRLGDRLTIVSWRWGLHWQSRKFYLKSIISTMYMKNQTYTECLYRTALYRMLTSWINYYWNMNDDALTDKVSYLCVK